MNYELKTKEELIDLLEGQDDKIEELEQEVNEASELTEEVCNLQQEIEEISSSLPDRDKVFEKAFYAGIKAANNLTVSPLKAWLNFKVEERL